MKIFEKFRPVFMAEGGGGMAAAAAAAGGEGGTGDGGAGEGGAGDAWQAPDGIPAEYLGASADETLSKLLPAFNDNTTRMQGLRDKLAKVPSAPDTADAYTFTPGEKLEPFFTDLDKSPAWNHARTAAHKHGLSQKQLQGCVSDVYGPMFDEGLLAAPYDAKAEVQTFMKATGQDAKAVTATLEGLDTFANGLAGQLQGVPENMKAEVKAQLISLTDTAAGNFLLQALQGRLSESGFRVAGEGVSSGMLTDQDLAKLHSDPRIDPKNRNHPDPNRRFDPELRKRYDEASNRER